MALSEIVSVAIQAGTVNPARKGFGIPLFMSYHTAWSGSEVRSYATMSEVKADFASTTLQYAWAAEVFSQKPRPKKIKIARLPTPTGVYHTQKIDGNDLAASTTIEGTVTLQDGSEHAISIAWNTDLATTLADLKTFLDALTGIGTCSISTGVLTCPADAYGLVHFDFSTSGVDVRDVTADLGFGAALDAAVLIDGDFYAVHVDCDSPKNMDKVARWAAANSRRAFFAPQYTKPSQFVSGEFSSGSDYTALLANDSAIGLITNASRLSFADAAWTGAMLPLDPGSATWAFKKLQALGADAWTSTERTAIEVTSHANSYTTEASVDITRPGKTFGGEWIDVVIGLDWLEARLQERLFALLVNNGKIPYTNAGVQLVVAEVRAQLREAEDRGVLASGWVVTYQDVADADPADKAARILRGIEFSATLAGAIHSMDIVGTVTA